LRRDLGHVSRLSNVLFCGGPARYWTMAWHRRPVRSNIGLDGGWSMAVLHVLFHRLGKSSSCDGYEWAIKVA
jgi:hypothetical protein